MKKYENYLAIVISALTVLILGWWNPTLLQSRTSLNSPSGYPNYLWLSLAVLIVGAFIIWWLNPL